MLSELGDVEIIQSYKDNCNKTSVTLIDCDTDDKKVKKTINSKEIIEEYENLGKRIADLRYKNGCSQQNLSKALNIPQSSYSNYETGNRKMPITLIKRIAEHFNVTVDYLLDMNCSKSSAISIALHQDTDRWTNEELEYLNVVKDFILEKRKQKGDRN